MKPFLTFLCILLLSSTASLAQVRGQDDVPSLIKDSFLSDFPEARHVIWQRRTNRYVIKFVLNGFDQQAHYSGTGTWRFTEIVVPENMMPPNSLEHCRSRYPGAPIISTGYHDEEGNRYYRIDVSLNGISRQLRYDDDGHFIDD